MSNIIFEYQPIEDSNDSPFLNFQLMKMFLMNECEIRNSIFRKKDD